MPRVTREMVERLEHAIGTVLADPGCTTRADALAQEIAAAGGAERAATIIETVARTRSPAKAA